MKSPDKWNSLKKSGSSHYRPLSDGDTQPIDLYRSLGLFNDFALASIIKYAARQKQKGLNESDLSKIQHYAELLKATL
jgi:hypothetical protein